MSPVLGTTPTDPDFYSSKIARASQLLRSYSQGVQARRQAQEEEERGEIERFVRAAGSMPELASTWGLDLKKRLGSKYPELAPVVDTIQSKNVGAQQLQQTAERAGKRFYDEWDGLWGKYRGLKQQVETSPDTLPSMFGPIPNPHKLSSYAELSKIDPARLPHLAASSLPPSERHAALAWAKANYGQEIPDETLVDWFKTLPADQAGLYGLRQGLISDPTGELSQSLRNQTGLSLSQADREKQTFDNDQRKARLKDSKTTSLLSDRLQRERNDIDYDRDITKMDRSQRYEVSNIRLRESFQGSGSGRGSKPFEWSHKDVLSLNKQEVGGWRDRMQDEAATGEDAAEKANKRKAYLKNNPQPPSLTDSEARAVATVIRERTQGMGEEEKAQVGEEVYRNYTAHKQRGLSGADALRAVKRSEGVPSHSPASTQSTTGSPTYTGPTRSGRKSGKESSRPPIISAPEIESRIKNEVSRVEPDPLKRRELVSRITAEYQRLVATGMSPAQAMAEIERED